MGLDLKARAERGAIRVIGLMSGTSLDGVDAAWLETDGEAEIRPGPALTRAYDAETREVLEAAIKAAPALLRGEAPAQAFAAAEAALTASHGAAVAALIEETGEAPDLIGFHGQTVLHRPEKRVTVQLGDGPALALETGVSVAFDFRSADVAAGGEGAPFAPLYHAARAQGLARPLGVLNLGGVGNLTWIGAAGDVIAFDTGPANAPIDDWMRAHERGPFDRDGRAAAAGRVHEDMVARMLDHPYFDAAPPKSLDRQDFTAGPVRGMGLSDGAATLTAFSAAAVAAGLAHCPAPPTRLLVTGGGARNPSLMAELKRRTRIPLAPVETVGWRSAHLEAEAFAWLAARVVRGLALSLPSTTGVPEPMAGGRLVHPNMG